MSIRLGDQVRCVVTGFKGIATARLEYLDGTIDYAVTPQHSKADGTYPKAEYLSQTRLERTGEGIHVEPVERTIGFSTEKRA